jgi:hypothetical protein
VLKRRPRWLTAVLAALAAIPLLVTPASAAASNSVTVFYKPPAAWSTVNIHYAPAGGSWTTVPGVAMTAASCADWYTKAVGLGTATGIQATFNNGSGTWDNNNGANYKLNAGASTVKDGVVTGDVTDPCTAVPADTTAPSAPGVITASVDHVTVTLGWGASTDDRGVTGYQLTRTGARPEPSC